MQHRCQPLASLASRKRAYWREVVGLVPTLAIMCAVTAGIGWALVKWLNAPVELTLLVAVLAVTPPIWMFLPSYPTEDDVRRDQALRRAAGMPDHIETDE
jgi:hypothetical protein